METTIQGQNDQIKILKEENGVINYVKFSSSQAFANEEGIVPETALDFFKSFLNITSSDNFIKEIQRQRDKHYIHEHYNQFYEGLKVEGGGYNFHFKDGRMYLAHGHYVKIEGLNIHPFITAEKAAELFAEYKHFPKDSIKNIIHELLIKEVPFTNEAVGTMVPNLV